MSAHELLLCAGGACSAEHSANRENAEIATSLKQVDPQRPRGSIYRAYTAFANTRIGRWLSVHVLWKIDPVVMRLTGGRFGLGMMLPTALLETRGARSGEPRRNAVLYFNDGERVIVVASKLGLPEHPAWFHNLSANPDVVLGGTPMHASEVSDELERDRLWSLADQVFPPFADYRRRAGEAGRTIPIVALEPKG